MLIGALSDTHDNIALIEKAVQTINSKNVNIVLHAGDYCSPFTISYLKKLHCNFIGVFGNNDGDHQLLTKRFQETNNCIIRGRFAHVNADGYRIALLHGDDTELLNTIIETGYFDAVIHGHSHIPHLEYRGKTLSINPGEICGYLTGKPTFALLDTDKHQAQIIEF